MGHYLQDLDARLREVGFAGRILGVTSQGGLAEIEMLAAAPIYGLNSGASLAPLAGSANRTCRQFLKNNIMRQPIRQVWNFLSHGCFAAKTGDYEGWISLDFLGFSGANLDFSMRYAGFSAKKISRALLPLGGGGAGTGAGILTMQKRSMAHRASLAHFLLFCNQLLALIALAVGHRPIQVIQE